MTFGAIYLFFAFCSPACLVPSFSLSFMSDLSYLHSFLTQLRFFAGLVPFTAMATHIRLW